MGKNTNGSTDSYELIFYRLRLVLVGFQPVSMARNRRNCLDARRFVVHLANLRFCLLTT